jgi:hypothetical protein
MSVETVGTFKILKVSRAKINDKMEQLAEVQVTAGLSKKETFSFNMIVGKDVFDLKYSKVKKSGAK